MKLKEVFLYSSNDEILNDARANALTLALEEFTKIAGKQLGIRPENIRQYDLHVLKYLETNDSSALKKALNLD